MCVYIYLYIYVPRGAGAGLTIGSFLPHEAEARVRFGIEQAEPHCSPTTVVLVAIVCHEKSKQWQAANHYGN